jgi:hypothetical protein
MGKKAENGSTVPDMSKVEKTRDYTFAALKGYAPSDERFSELVNTKQSKNDDWIYQFAIHESKFFTTSSQR